MAAGVGVEGRDTHQTVNAALTAQETVGVFTLHLEGHAFQARFVAFQNVVDRHLEAVALAVAGVHPIQHGRPVLRFRSARARVEAQNRIAAVVLAPHHGFQLQSIRIGRQVGQLLFALRTHFLVGFFVQQHQHGFDVVRPGTQTGHMVDLALDLSHLAVDRRGALQIVPKFRLVHFFLQLGQLLLQLRQMQRVGGLFHRLAQFAQLLSISFGINHRHCFSVPF